MNTTPLTTYRTIITFVVLGVVFLLLPHITLANAVMSSIEGVLYKIVIIVFGGFAGISGVMLDYAINKMVIGFGDLYVDRGLGYTIDSLWVIVRDIFNLTFIFGLVYIGLRLIFDSSNSNARKTLINLILAALLVNFSLFITKFVVDFSNIATVQLVNTFQAGPNGAQIGGSFMQLFGATSLLGDVALTELVDKFKGFQGGAGLLYIFGTMIVLLVIAFVFMAGAILLMIRFVALNFYMLLSPLMFIGLVFPSAMKFTDEFWSGFLGKAFFAPAYILMLYFSHKILSTFQITGNGKLAAGFTSGNPVVIQDVFPPFILGAIFLIASLVVAQKMGATGANGVISVGKMMTGKAKAYAKNGAWASTYIARAPARAATNFVGGKALKSFNNWQADAQARAVAPGAGVGTKAVGWALTRNTTDRVARGAAESLKKAQFGTGTTNDQESDYARKVQANINQTQVENNRSATFEASEKALADMTTSTTNLIDALDKLGAAMKSMTKDEKLGIAKADINRIKNVHVAANLSDEDIEHFEKSGNFSAQQIDDIKSARKAGLTAVAAGGNTFASVSSTGSVSYTHPNATAPGPGGAPVSVIPDRRQNISAQGTQAVGKMPVSIFTQPAMYELGYLTPSMVEERIKRGISPTEKAAIRTALETAMGAGPGVLPSAVPAPILAAGPWINQWIKWEKSNSFHAANFFT